MADPLEQDTTYPMPGTHDPLEDVPEEDVDLPGLDMARRQDEEPAPMASVLAELAAPARAERTPRWKVPTRPGWSASYSLAVDQAVIRAASNAATPEAARRRPEGARADEMNEPDAYCRLLGRYNEALYRNGQQVYGSDGAPLTFSHPDLLRTYGVKHARMVVRRFFGDGGEGDGALVTHGRGLLDLSGHGRTRPDEDTEVDPT